MAGTFKPWSIKIKTDLRGLSSAGQMPSLTGGLHWHPCSQAPQRGWTDAAQSACWGPGWRCALTSPQRGGHVTSCETAGGVWGATWGGVRPCGSQIWQALGCFLCTESSGEPAFQFPLAALYGPHLPSPAPLFPLSMSVVGTWPTTERK